MMKIYLYLLSFILFFHFGKFEQPWFPRQIVFSPDEGQTIYAIDEINQRAYKRFNYSSTQQDTAYAFQHFPFAPSDSPQSKNYVQLLLQSPASLGCKYGTYWEYGTNNINEFPWFWNYNVYYFEIKNYMNFRYQLIHSENSTVDEDYWYSNQTCQPDQEEIGPCEEIYFKKGTQIPLRFVEVVRRGWILIRVKTNFTVISVGKPDDKYFDSIPTNWYTTCVDVNLGLFYHPAQKELSLNESTQVHIYLTAPPHHINTTDNVTIQWKATECFDCVEWTPKELTFNTKNFQEEQILTITRVKNGNRTVLVPIFNGGGYEHVPSQYYHIVLE